MASVVELLARSTVFLICELGNGQVSTGTGFIMNFHADKESGMAMPVIVTNKHVVRDSVRFNVAMARDCGGVASNLLVGVEMGASSWIGHPDADVDLCAMPVAPILKSAEKN